MNTEKSQSNIKLISAVLARYVVTFIVLGLLFFSTAGTLAYVNGWLYIITMMTVMGLGFILIYIKDKSLLEKRIRTKEKEKQQIIFVVTSGLLILCLFGLPGLDYRYAWSHVPIWAIIVGEVLVIVGYLLNLVAMLENSYASRVVEIQAEQKLIDTGLYGFVRHPMYMAMSLVYIGTPLLLGSYLALILGLLVPFTLALRIQNEEKVLKEGLEGYQAYTTRVKYRMIPYLW